VGDIGILEAFELRSGPAFESVDTDFLCLMPLNDIFGSGGGLVDFLICRPPLPEEVSVLSVESDLVDTDRILGVRLSENSLLTIGAYLSDR
jgi:hypothetical protein